MAVGDRAYALIDVETGKVVSAKSVKTVRRTCSTAGRSLTPGEAGAAKPPVVVTLPDGTQVHSDSADCDAVLTRSLAGR